MNRRGYLACLLILTVIPVAAFAQTSPAKVDSSVYKACFSNGASKPEEVISACSAILQRDPEVAAAYYNRGVARMQLNQLEGALADFSKAVEINPKDPDAWNNRGLMYNRLGKPGDAVSDFTRAIELDSVYGKAYCNRGLVYLKLGRTADAEEDLKTAARLGVKEAEDYLKSKGIVYTLPHRFEIAFSYSQFDYKEDLQPPLKSTETGWIPQVRVGYSYVADDQFYFRAFGEISFGNDNTDYDGSTLTGTPVTGTTRDDFARSEVNMGYTFKENLPLSITPYIGLGYRYWKRDIGYNETYSWWYLPVGVKFLYPVNQKFSVGLNASMNIMFEGWMTISTKNDVYANTTVQLGNKLGYLAELPLSWRPYVNWAFTVTPWYEYSEIGQSPWEPLYYTNGTYSGFVVQEPSSRTYQYGVRVSTEYLF
ncbi:MAG TPA: tetratricopeptide repeat protein [Syntrophales bacterium]|nr:tetratricopeptide repeat protein [Syntrophales bacterium]